MTKQVSKNTILEVSQVHKSFLIGKDLTEIIHDVSFDIQQGDFLIIFGPSGCGKSTVLNMLLGLEPPTKGIIKFLGEDLYQRSDDQRALLRKKEVGMIYQQSNWVKSLNVLENVYFPLTLSGVEEKERKDRAMELLRLVDMEKAMEQIPTELSSGQQQRISLARALIANPTLLIADEPTGNLDSKSGLEIMNLFLKFNQQGKTVIMVTHDLEYLKYASTAIEMLDGKIEAEYKANDLKRKKFSSSKKGEEFKNDMLKKNN